MSSISDISKGEVIKFRDEPWAVIEFQHVNPGKGSSFVRTRIKNLATGKVMEQVFKSGESIEIVDVEKKRMQFLYSDAASMAFMDGVTFEQVTVSRDMVGEGAHFLKEGQGVTVNIYNGAPVSIELPKKVTLKVTESPPGVRGDSASSNVTKEVTLETGYKLLTPLFVKEGDEIIINTETGEYVERA